jgi:hypothetical protein
MPKQISSIDLLVLVMTAIGSRCRNVTDIDTSDDNEKVHALVERTEGLVPLEALRRYYGDRLHRRSNDFTATYGLRLVIAKLQRTSHGIPAVTSSS